MKIARYSPHRHKQIAGQKQWNTRNGNRSEENSQIDVEYATNDNVVSVL